MQNSEARTFIESPLVDNLAAKPLVQLKAFVLNVHVMKLYAASEGIEIPKETRDQLSQLTSVENYLEKLESGKKHELAVQKPEVVHKEPQPSPQASLGAESQTPAESEDDYLAKSLALAMTAHAEMSKIVAPATPASILYSQPPKDFGDFVSRQRLLFWLTFAALVATIGFIISTIWKTQLDGVDAQARQLIASATEFESRLPEINKLPDEPAEFEVKLKALVDELEHRSDDLAALSASTTRPDREWPETEVHSILEKLNTRPTGRSMLAAKLADISAKFRGVATNAGGPPPLNVTICNQCLNISAAMIGAAFFSLYTALRYIAQRTFDRTYSTQYALRFVLGVVAGTILANFGEYMLAKRGSGDTAIIITQSLLALLGGYSADAVNAILTRIAETLTTLVRGDGAQRARDEAQAETDKAKADAKKKVDDAKNEEVKRLLDTKAAVKPEDPAAAAKHDVINDLLKKASNGKK